MRVRPALSAVAVVLAVLAVLATGCSGDGATKTTGTGSQAQPADDPAEPAGETELDGESEDPGGVDTGDLPDISGFDCDVELTVSGDVTGDLGTGTAVTNDAGGPKAFYQALGEDLLLSAYSEGDGIEPSVIVQAGPETYGTNPGAAGLDIKEDGSGFTVDTEVQLIPSGDKTAQVTGTMSC